jgi:hypothetical protein
MTEPELHQTVQPTPGQVPPVPSMHGYLLPGQPMPGGPAPVTPPMLGPPVRRLSQRRRVLVILSILILIVGAISGAIWYVNRNSPDRAKVGDCLRKDGPDAVEIIACNDPSAQFKVVGRLENQSDADITLSPCDAFHNTTHVYWSRTTGGTGYVLCLADNH